jgi:hypothetical protein
LTQPGEGHAAKPQFHPSSLGGPDGFGEPADRHVARLPPTVPLELDDYQRFTPGHMKLDYAYLLAHDHPDAILRPVAVGRGETWRMLTDAGYRFDAFGACWLRGPPMARR